MIYIRVGIEKTDLDARDILSAHFYENIFCQQIPTRTFSQKPKYIEMVIRGS